MLTLLNKSYPSYKDTAELLKFAQGVALFLFLFFVVFKPFELHNFEFRKLVFISALYSVATFLAIWIYASLLKVIFPNFLFKKDWKVKDEVFYVFFLLVFVIVSIFIINLFVFVNHDYSVQNFIYQVFKVLAIAVIPTFVVSVIKYQLYLSQILDNIEAQQTGNKQLATNKISKIHNPHLLVDRDEEYITIHSKNKSNALQINGSKFLFAKSDGNYIDIFYLSNDKVISETIRTPLKTLQNQIESYGNLIQCHRTYIINIQHLEQIIGNRRSAIAKLKFGKQEIPISRSYYQKCKSLFDEHLTE